MLRGVTRDAGLALEAAASTSHLGRALKERGLSLAQWALLRHGPVTTSAARRARSSKLECFTSSPETASTGEPAWHDTRRWLGVGGRS